jgi:hypothetical protein
VLPGYIGNQQDLVMMRPKGGRASARAGL